MPTVFGFQKVFNLRTHEITYGTVAFRYSYHDVTHPFEGINAPAHHQSLGENFGRTASGNLGNLSIQADPAEAKSPYGGKLKEIEVRDFKDLATLTIGMLAKKTKIPSSITIRINPPAAFKKENQARSSYLTPNQFNGFHEQVTKKLAAHFKISGQKVADYLPGLSVGELQEVNAEVRKLDLESFVPARRADEPT